MSRTPVCRDFLRGSCRFGSKCKFLHTNSQQARQQSSNPFGFGGKSQGQTQPKGGNYFSSLASQTNQAQTTIKEHRCNNPKDCKLQIKEDLEHELPVFWRLTCYAHGKFLPNDLVGDVSFEELRAQAYAAGRQGVSFDSVVQNERNMFNAKKREFDYLLNNPYSGPATSGSSSPFTHNMVLSDASKLPFGSAIPAPSSAPFKSFPSFTQEPFQTRGLTGFSGAKQPGSFLFGLGSSSGAADSLMSSHSALPQSPVMPGFSFGVRSPEPLPNIQGPGVPNVFSSSSAPFSGFGQSSFNFNTVTQNSSESPSNLFVRSGPFQALNEAEMSDSSPLFNQKNIPKETVPEEHENTTRKVDIWARAKWNIGEIPEEEPPFYAR
ncbi:hypothetical protein KP509_17G080700 [Ceratopteris richardii]|uniref:C3H1-type domain-containing protein n=1 Tax=Ceratopteris richardii TaxID=49495 RepID=A0A8T2SVU7_CERRI|nr:hypothetical protein KP509_17G080700 [Ceratopteris richardii]